MKQVILSGIDRHPNGADSMTTGSRTRRPFVVPVIERHSRLESLTASCIEIVGGVPVEVPCGS